MSDSITKSLEFIKTRLDPNHTFIELANIATLCDNDEFITSSFPIIMSVINIEEDKLMRNPNVYKPTIESGNLAHYNQLTNPILHLNIYLLFSIYEKKGATNKYLDLFDYLESVIHAFQIKNVFTKSDGIPANTEKIVLEMISLSMENLSQMWSFLGNKYMPSVLYKMRITSIAPAVSEETIFPINSFEIQKLNDSNTESLISESKFYSHDDILKEIQKKNK